MSIPDEVASKETKKKVVIGVKDGPMSVLSFDPVAMVFSDVIESQFHDVNYLHYSDRETLFALRPGQLAALIIEDEYAPTFKNVAQSSAVSDPTAVEVSIDNRIVFTAHFSNNLLSARKFDGEKFSEPQKFDCGWAHQFRPHFNNKWAYAACMKNTLVQFNIDPEKGSISPMSKSKVEIKGGPRHMEFHPAGHTLYVLLQISSEVAVFDIDPETGALSDPPAQIIAATANRAKSKSSDIHITPDGEWLYAFNRSNQEMAVFEVKDDHKLRLKHSVAMDKGEVRDWAMAADGSYLITASNEGHVGVWRIDQVTGKLSLADQQIGLGNAISVAIIE